MKTIHCDFRDGCALAVELFGPRAEILRQAIRANPHLAEAVYALGVSQDVPSAIAMARAIQDARTYPPTCCGCAHRPTN